MKKQTKKKDSESDNNVRFSFTFPLRKLRGTKKNKKKIHFCGEVVGKGGNLES